MASFGVPKWGPYFSWKEPLAVRRGVSPDSWHAVSFGTKCARAVGTTSPLLGLIALAILFRSKSAPPIDTAKFAALFGGLAALAGLLAGFGVPAVNERTRRRIRVNEDKISVIRAERRSISRYDPGFIIDSYEIEKIAVVRFGSKHYEGRPYNVMCVRLLAGAEVIVGIGKKESVSELRRYMTEWGYPVE